MNCDASLDQKVVRTFFRDAYFLENPEKIVGSPVEGNLFGYAGNNPLSFVDPSGDFTSPTGSKKIRNDSVGLGHYDAPRRGAKGGHAGVDLASKAGAKLRSPISGTAEYISKKSGEQFVRVTGRDKGEKISVRLVHIRFDKKMSGKIMRVKEGNLLKGVRTENLKKHKRFKGATPHVHMEVYKNGTKRVNPIPYLNNQHGNKTSPKARLP